MEISNEDCDRLAHFWVQRCIHSMVHHLGKDDTVQTDDLRNLVAQGLQDLYEELKSLCRLAESEWELEWERSLLRFWLSARGCCALILLDPVAALWPAIHSAWGRRKRHPSTLSQPVWLIRNVLPHAPFFTPDGWQY